MNDGFKPYACSGWSTEASKTLIRNGNATNYIQNSFINGLSRAVCIVLRPPWYSQACMLSHRGWGVECWWYTAMSSARSAGFTRRRLQSQYSRVSAWQGARVTDMWTGIACWHNVTQFEGPCQTQRDYNGYLELLIPSWSNRDATKYRFVQGRGCPDSILISDIDPISAKKALIKALIKAVY